MVIARSSTARLAGSPTVHAASMLAPGGGADKHILRRPGGGRRPSAAAENFTDVA
jgi:hypothetical protein